VLIEVLYHWSPRERRRNIENRGLLPGRRNVLFDEETDPAYRAFRQPAVCLAPTPSSAWGVSGMAFGRKGGTWDLWQVSLDPADEVEVRRIDGRRIMEVRVHNRIPKSRVWWVASRER
jgi:hypothetical protein